METDFYEKIQPYVSLGVVLLSSGLAFSLVLSARRFAGKGWLLASTALTLASWPAFQIVALIARHAETADGVEEMFRWYDVLNLVQWLGTGCFIMFLFSLWSSSRMRLETRSLLFSFRGRIPRSAFWILLAILFPLGILIGLAPATSKDTGAVKVTLWLFYGIWCLVSIWMSLAVYAKRWHDLGRSGWMSLVVFIPLVGPLVLLGFLGFVPGATGTNVYGSNPLALNEPPPVPPGNPTDVSATLVANS